MIMTEDQKNELLIRLDERTDTIMKSLDDFVTQAEFKPVRKVVNGLVAGVLGGALAATLAFIYVKPVIASFISLF